MFIFSRCVDWCALDKGFKYNIWREASVTASLFENTQANRHESCGFPLAPFYMLRKKTLCTTFVTPAVNPCECCTWIGWHPEFFIFTLKLDYFCKTHLNGKLDLKRETYERDQKTGDTVYCF